MFRFLKEYSYEVFKFFLTQIAIAILGLVLAFSTSSNDMLFLVSSIFSGVFYICLLYSEGWEIGSKDRPRITNGRMKFDPIKGAKFSILSNFVNYILVLVMFVSFFLGSKDGAGITFFGNTYAITYTVQRFISAMFMGINAYFAPHQLVDGAEIIVNDSIFHPVFYLLTTIPSVISVALGYYMGAKDRKILTVNTPN